MDISTTAAALRKRASELRDEYRENSRHFIPGGPPPRRRPIERAENLEDIAAVLEALTE